MPKDLTPEEKFEILQDIGAALGYYSGIYHTLKEEVDKCWGYNPKDLSDNLVKSIVDICPSGQIEKIDHWKQRFLDQ